jgi:hypothetical protein
MKVNYLDMMNKLTLMKMQIKKKVSYFKPFIKIAEQLEKLESTNHILRELRKDPLNESFALNVAKRVIHGFLMVC